MKITEDYVSFEVAKLLVQKGLRYNDAEYESYYTLKGKVVYFKNKSKEINVAPRFTLQIACKWLREVHNIYIVIHPYTDKEGQCWSFIFDKYAHDCWQELGIYITDYWNSYEKAVESALKYVLENLI